MAKPIIQVCSINGCTGVRLTDKTDWEAIGILPDNASLSVIVEIDGEEFDVDSQVPDEPGTDGFTYDDIEIDLADGWHDVVYTINDEETSVTTTVRFFSYCDIKCCIFKKISEAAKIKDLCKQKDELIMTMYMWTLYQDMLAAANGCDPDVAEDRLNALTALCGGPVDCGCK